MDWVDALEWTVVAALLVLCLAAGYHVVTSDAIVRELCWQVYARGCE